MSGGGNLGALQVGMLRALLEAGIVPDLILGSSVGALNGAALAADPTLPGVAAMETVWRGISAGDLMPSGLLPSAVGLARRGESLYEPAGLAQVIDEILPVTRFEELVVPFECVATDLDGAHEVWFHSGELRAPILASAALPMIYPPVEIDGVRYLDGAIVNDVPISRALERGASAIYVLQTGSLDRPRPDIRRPVDAAISAYWIARVQRFRRDLAAVPPTVACHLIPTGAVDLPRYNDFTRTADLITHGYDQARAYLRRGPTQATEADVELEVAPLVNPPAALSEQS